MITISLCLASLDAKASVVLNSTNFPDDAFRTYISGLTGVSVDGTISDAAIASVEKIDVKNMEVSSLKDVEYFTALEELQCSQNNLTSIDISKNVLLRYFICSSNNISSLDVTKNTYLYYIDCSLNKLKSLDVSKNTKLESPAGSQNMAYDLNGDGKISTADIQVIINEMKK